MPHLPSVPLLVPQRLYPTGYVTREVREREKTYSSVQLPLDPTAWLSSLSSAAAEQVLLVYLRRPQNRRPDLGLESVASRRAHPCYYQEGRRQDLSQPHDVTDVSSLSKRPMNGEY